MKRIRLSGREASVLRAMGFSLPMTGQQIVERTHLDPEEVTDILNGMMDLGYVESNPMVDRVDVEAMRVTEFELNPNYAHELKPAMGYR